MRILEVVLFVLGVAVTALAAPLSFVEVQSFHGPVKPGSYVITLKHPISKEHHLEKFNRKFDDDDASFITHPEWNLINGFAAHLSPQALSELRKDPDVASIEEDGIMSVKTVSTEYVSGLCRFLLVFHSSPQKRCNLGSVAYEPQRQTFRSKSKRPQFSIFL
jgi:hypothetical protein